jgi:hypothetical protein
MRIIASVVRHGLGVRVNAMATRAVPSLRLHDMGSMVESREPARLIHRIEQTPLNRELARGVAFDAMATAALAGGSGLERSAQ